MTPLSLPALLTLVAAPFIGSFLGTLIIRLPTSQPIVFSRSACPHCAYLLEPADLIPLVSWAVRRGKCRHCGAFIGLFYPVVELAALVVAVSTVVAMQKAPGWLMFASIALGWVLLVLSWIDARHRLLPDTLTLPLIPAGLLVNWVLASTSLMDHALGAAVGFILFRLIAILYMYLRGHAGLGGGDAKLLAASGAWVAWQGLPSVLLIASFSGIIYALIRLLAAKELHGTEPIPFGPFLAIGLWWVWLLGPLSVG